MPRRKRRSDVGKGFRGVMGDGRLKEPVKIY